jgi:hypothetical protein
MLFQGFDFKNLLTFDRELPISHQFIFMYFYPRNDQLQFVLWKISRQ